MNKVLIVLSIVIGLGATAFAFSRDKQTGAQAVSDTGQINVEQGRLLYVENCASCHGVNLEGQPNWQLKGDDGRLPAPPHNDRGHTWHHGDGLLFNYTKLGGKEALAEHGIDFDSGMPGFGETLSDAQIWDITNYIKSTWSEQMLEAQAQRTEAEQISEN